MTNPARAHCAPGAPRASRAARAAKRPRAAPPRGRGSRSRRPTGMPRSCCQPTLTADVCQLRLTIILVAVGLDREDFERRDFPTARRGYDPAAVDAHLRHLANEIERLGRAAETPAPAPGLAASTSEQVRSILEAAEESAGRLRADAGE